MFGILAIGTFDMFVVEAITYRVTATMDLSYDARYRTKLCPNQMEIAGSAI